MNATITISGAHATITISDYSQLSSAAKNSILGLILTEDCETIHHMENNGVMIISGELDEMKSLFILLWDLR